MPVRRWPILRRHMASTQRNDDWAAEELARRAPTALSGAWDAADPAGRPPCSVKFRILASARDDRIVLGVGTGVSDEVINESV